MNTLIWLAVAQVLLSVITLIGLVRLRKTMAIKVSEIKTAVAEIEKNNREALAEIGNKIADLNQQIADLVSGNSDPTVTDAEFEAKLATAKADAQALADVVPGTPEPPTA